MTIKHWKTGRQHILYRADLQQSPNAAPFNTDFFDPEKLAANGQIYATAQGRGTSYFFKSLSEQKGTNDWILRHYWRGGLIGKICRDQFLWQALSATRPFRELQLLKTLEHLQLPAPRAVAGRVTYHGCSYQADIITTTITDSVSLTECLKSETTPQLWKTVGATLARFHQHNIYHADLNANNILINANNDVFLIDFDRGRQMPANGSHHWRRKNLARLLRSLKKETAKYTSLGFKVIGFDWEALMTGYSSHRSKAL